MAALLTHTYIHYFFLFLHLAIQICIFNTVIDPAGWLRAATHLHEVVREAVALLATPANL